MVPANGADQISNRFTIGLPDCRLRRFEVWKCCLPFRPSLPRTMESEATQMGLTIITVLFGAFQLPASSCSRGHGYGEAMAAPLGPSVTRLRPGWTNQVGQILFWKVETTMRLRLRDDTTQCFP